MMTPAAEAPAALSTFTKLTTRIPPDQLDWLKGEVKRYRAEHPRAPKITIEELMASPDDERDTFRVVARKRELENALKATKRGRKGPR